MTAENCIDYVEIPVTDLGKARDFLAAMFGWSFQERGDDYMSFNDGRRFHFVDPVGTEYAMWSDR